MSSASATSATTPRPTSPGGDHGAVPRGPADRTGSTEDLPRQEWPAGTAVNGISSSMPPRPAPRDLRASDADRERVVTVLNAALGDGRITPEEHDERVHAALSARTLGDLVGLTSDLVLPSGQPIQIHDGAVLNGITLVNGSSARSHGPAAGSCPRVHGQHVGADVTLDFREAILDRPAHGPPRHALGGTVRLFVPDGVTVTVDGTIIFGRQRGRRPAPGTARLGPAADRGAGAGAARRDHWSSPRRSRVAGSPAVAPPDPGLPSPYS